MSGILTSAALLRPSPPPPSGSTPPAFVTGAQAKTQGKGFSNGSLVSIPAVVAGDVLIASISIAGSTTITGLAGFTQIAFQAYTGASYEADTWVGWKRASADAAATTAAISLTGGQYGSAMVRAYRGCVASGSPIAASALFAPTTGTSGTTKDSAALSGLTASDLCVYAWNIANDPAGTGSGSVYGVTGTGVTNFDYVSNYGVVAMVEAAPVGGSAPVMTCTSAKAANTWGGMTFALIGT